MVEFPPEIWHHVICFIPAATLRHLYGVNPVFFDVIMNKKYRHVVIDSRENCLRQKLECLLNPTVAHRVQSVHVKPDLSEGVQCTAPEAPQVVPIHGMDRMISCLMNSEHTQNDRNTSTFCYEPRPSQEQVSRDIPEIIQTLVNLESFHLEWGVFEPFPISYADFWPAIASRLKAITITATTTGLRGALPLPGVKFTRLQSFCLTIKHKNKPLDEDTDFRDVQLLVASFLNSLQGALESLSVIAMPPHDLSDIYEHLGYFSRLRTFNVDLTVPSFSSCNWKNPVFLPSSDFLLRHQNCIENLSTCSSRLAVLKVQEVDKWESKYDYEMPKLRSFSISTSILTGRRKRTEEFLRRNMSALQSLEIVGNISPNELGELLDVLTEPPHGSILTKFSISIYRMDLSLLLKLATHLPALKSLRLRIMRITTGTSIAFTPGQFFPLRLPPHEDVHDFVTEMLASQELKRWRLCDVTIDRLSCCVELTLWNLMQLFAASIPTIYSFAGMGHMDISDLTDMQQTNESTRCSGGSECYHGKDGTDASP